LLLTGPAGVGKTLTAEAVAEELKTPLYSISAGQLGTGVESVEEQLSSVLEFATNWNAILLLDEADIFLEKRSMDNLERNGLVSSKSWLEMMRDS
jgi:SpoVK/Ycf46/Vps4 family AAA+-type ATPase